MEGVADELLKSAASQLQGVQRRQFLGEVCLGLCDGNVRQAETRFGWGRETIAKGLENARLWYEDVASTEPIRFEVQNGAGVRLPVREAIDDLTRDGETGTVVTVELADNDYRVRFGAGGRTSGKYRLELRMLGATDGDRRVTAEDRQRAELAILLLLQVRESTDRNGHHHERSSGGHCLE